MWLKSVIQLVNVEGSHDAVMLACTPLIVTETGTNSLSIVVTLIEP